MTGSTPKAEPSPDLIYKKSSKHCEPITAQKPASKCQRWAEAHAQALLDFSEEMGGKRVNTRHGIAFVAQQTGDGTWHGYPEAWDKIDWSIVARWLAAGRVRRRDLRRWPTLDAIRTAWKELEDAE